MNKEFTQKDADELLNIEIIAKQLIERIQTLRAKFISIEGEIKKKRQPTKKQLAKQQFELEMKRYFRKGHEKRLKGHLLADGDPQILFDRFPEDKELIQKFINEIKQHP